jgi:hypothetical protein
MNWDEFEDADQPGAVGTGPAAAPAVVGTAGKEPAPFSFDEFETVGSVDANGEERSHYANGVSPDRPINESPVDAIDRLKMSVGNAAGKEEFLKTKFSEVVKDKHGNFVVKKDDLWHTVDPEGLGDGDAWARTKELALDLLDVAPEAAAIGTSVGAGLATGGASVGLQITGAGGIGAVTAAARTSLGRLAGTYKASPEEQVMDVAFESVLNLLGTAVPLGVKPTGAWMAKNIPGVVKAWGGLSEGTRKVIAKTYGALSAGEDAFETMSKQGPAVASSFKEYAKAGSDDAMRASIGVNTTSTVEALAETAQKVLSKSYEKNIAQIAKTVPGDFVPDLSAPLRTVQEELITSGLGAFTKNTGEKLVRMSTEESLEALAKGKLPSGSKFVLNSLKDMSDDLAKTGNASTYLGLADNVEAYKHLHSNIQQLNAIAGAKQLSGERGARQLLDIQKYTNEMTRTLTDLGETAGNSNLRIMGARLNDRFKTHYTDVFDKFSPKNQAGESFYKILNKEYSDSAFALDPLIRVAKAPSSKRAEIIGAKLAQVGGKSVTEKQAVAHLASLAGKHGLPEAAVIKDLQGQLAVNDTVLSFMPILSPKLRNPSLAAGAVTFGGAAAMSTGSILPVAATAAVTSPRLAFGLWNAKDFVANLTKTQLDALVKNPEALQGLVQSAVQTPLLRDQAKEALLGGGGQQ